MNSNRILLSAFFLWTELMTGGWAMAKNTSSWSPSWLNRKVTVTSFLNDIQESIDPSLHSKLKKQLEPFSKEQIEIRMTDSLIQVATSGGIVIFEPKDSEKGTFKLSFNPPGGRSPTLKDPKPITIDLNQSTEDILQKISDLWPASTHKNSGLSKSVSRKVSLMRLLFGTEARAEGDEGSVWSFLGGLVTAGVVGWGVGSYLANQRREREDDWRWWYHHHPSWAYHWKRYSYPSADGQPTEVQVGGDITLPPRS